jgi:hypothetical protein
MLARDIQSNLHNFIRSLHPLSKKNLMTCAVAIKYYLENYNLKSWNFEWY